MPPRLPRVLCRSESASVRSGNGTAAHAVFQDGNYQRHTLSFLTGESGDQGEVL
jgi:hypothetical protein